MRHFSKRFNNDFYEDLKQYILSFSEMSSGEHTQVVEEAFGAMDELYDKTVSFNAPALAMPKASTAGIASRKATAEIDINEKKEPSFSEKLFEIIDRKGLKDSAVYKKADIDRRLFSKIRSDFDYHPAKNTAIRLCLALELDIIQTERLLESAGYCLSLSSTTDLVIRYCIEHKIFDIISVNEAIEYFSGKLI